MDPASAFCPSPQESQRQLASRRKGTKGRQRKEWRRGKTAVSWKMQESMAQVATRGTSGYGGLNRVTISELLHLGTRTQMSVGGNTKTTLRASKSEAFETMVKPFAFAYSQIAAPSLPPNPH